MLRVLSPASILPPKNYIDSATACIKMRWAHAQQTKHTSFKCDFQSDPGILHSLTDVNKILGVTSVISSEGKSPFARTSQETSRQTAFMLTCHGTINIFRSKGSTIRKKISYCRCQANSRYMSVNATSVKTLYWILLYSFKITISG